MRNSFVRELTDIATEDPNTILITGDLGFGVLTDFAKKLPAQYINAGVAEQNMTALAVGLALEGKTVYTYSIANFPTFRCLEQIRNDACYHNANVKIVAVGGGFSYGSLGVSHHATEDLAIMRALPNMTVLAPGDPIEATLATRAAHHTPGTCYLRLGRGGERVIHPQQPNFLLGKGIAIETGGRIALLSTGGILDVAAGVRLELLNRNIKAALYSFPTLKPIDQTLISELAADCDLLVTVEEHSRIGGLGSAVAEIIAECPPRAARLLRCGLDDKFSSIVGSQAYLRTRYKIDASGITDRVLQALSV